jgi:hypothetical protein
MRTTCVPFFCLPTSSSEVARPAETEGQHGFGSEERVVLEDTRSICNNSDKALAFYPVFAARLATRRILFSGRMLLNTRDIHWPLHLQGQPCFRCLAALICYWDLEDESFRG